MPKLVKVLSTEFNISTSTAMVIETAGLKFILDERFDWVDVYTLKDQTSDESLIKQVDLKEDEVITTFEEFKVFVLNWIFENVEVVENIDNKE